MNRTYQFYKASIITVILLYILVLVGGFVRITGSGDDCPDWPKCYGSWVPPFTIDDIPAEFNPTEDKVYGSWIEYFNRLVGVVLGLSMLYTFLKSFYVFKRDKVLFYGSLSSLLLIIISGWLGGQIATSIDGQNIIYQHSVSIHLYVAILTTISLVYTTNRGFIVMFPNLEDNSTYSSIEKTLLLLIFIINLLLVFSGSYIRTFLDDNLLVNLPYFIRMEKYVYQTGLVKFIHPFLGFSMLTCAAILWNYIMNLSKSSKTVKLVVKFILYAICTQILIGECLRFNMIHESFRLYHLWLSSVILGLIIVAFQRIKLTHD
jgi:cytochrome c oxidase assembly protein subunit 15